MKKTSYSILFILIAVSSLFSACSKEQIELVTQDLSYQLDPDYISVNIPDTFKFDPANVVYLTGQKNITLHGTNDETTTTIIGGNELHFTVRIKKEFDNDVTLRLVKDPALMNSYPEDISKYKEILEESFSIPETILERGKKETTFTLTFQQVEKLNEIPGYLLPLRLEIVGAANDLKVSETNYFVMVKLDIEYAKENIVPGNEPFNGVLFNDIITFDSPKSQGLGSLKDGAFTGSSWYPNDKNTPLIIKIPEKETIKGIVINTEGRWALGHFTVFSEGNSVDIKQGEFSISKQTAQINVQFKEPVTTNTFRLENLLTYTQGPQPDLCEVRLVR